ncbi:MAG TPA: hypothetical protein DCO78_13450 [Chitinophagaceae bacterium]|nr:hypothetical protein [Chitinophagaceae bacterium]
MIENERIFIEKEVEEPVLTEEEKLKIIIEYKDQEITALKKKLKEKQDTLDKVCGKLRER